MDEFTTKEGLRQGGLLIPTLFNVYMDDIKEINKTTTKLCVSRINMQRVML